MCNPIEQQEKNNNNNTLESSGPLRHVLRLNNVTLPIDMGKKSFLKIHNFFFLDGKGSKRGQNKRHSLAFLWIISVLSMLRT